MTAKLSQKSENQFIFGEHDGADGRFREVKTKIFDSERRERIIRVFFRNLTFSVGAHRQIWNARTQQVALK